MSSNLKVNTILPSTGTAIGIGTDSGNVDILGHIVGHNTPNISGINSVTASHFYGDGSQLSGIDASSIKFGGSTKAQANAAGVVVTGICTATSFSGDGSNLTGLSTPFRNLIINGAMQVAQRGTSSTSSGFYTVDRFQLNFTGTNEAPTQAQAALTSSDTPYSLGFRSAYKVTNGNQTGGGGAAKFIRFKTTIEAQDIAQSGWNYTSSSSNVTLSFWVKASVAQTYYGRLQTEDGTARNYPFSFALSENTWTKVTKTISGNTSPTLQFDDNNGAGLILEIVPYYGTNYTGSMSLDTWATYSDRTPDNTANWYETNDATFEITGVQLEVGSQATPFEHRSFTDEELRCQRYFWKYSGTIYGGAYGGNGFCNYSLPTRMRIKGALSYTGLRTSSSFYDYSSAQLLQIQMGATNPYISNPQLDSEL